MRSSVHSLAIQRFIELARPFQIRQAEHAAGRCLSVSLDLAVHAQQRLGIGVRLVRWRVVGDPHFVDHWAVQLDDERVIDPTRVQVDGKQKLVCDLADYPPHFKNRRVYPARLLTASYENSLASQEGGRLSDRFVWFCGSRLFAFDVAEALRQRRPSALAAALRSGMTFLRCFLMASTTHALEQRAARLLERLHSQPDMAALRSASQRHNQTPSAPKQPARSWPTRCASPPASSQSVRKP